MIANKKLNVVFSNSLGSFEYPVSISNIILNGKYDDAYFSAIYPDYVTVNSFYPNSFPNFSGYAISFDFGVSNYDSKKYLELIRKEFDDKSYKAMVNQYNLDKRNENIFATIESIEKNIYAVGTLPNSVATLICFCIYSLNLIFIIFSLLKEQYIACIIDALGTLLSFLFVYSNLFFINLLISRTMLFSTFPILVNFFFFCVFLTAALFAINLSTKHICNMVYYKELNI